MLFFKKPFIIYYLFMITYFLYDVNEILTLHKKYCIMYT